MSSYPPPGYQPPGAPPQGYGPPAPAYTYPPGQQPPPGFAPPAPGYAYPPGQQPAPPATYPPPGTPYAYPPGYGVAPAPMGYPPVAAPAPMYPSTPAPAMPVFHMPDETAMRAAQEKAKQDAMRRGGGGGAKFVKIPGPRGEEKWDAVPVGFTGSLSIWILPSIKPGAALPMFPHPHHFWKSSKNPKGASLTCLGKDVCLVCKAKEAALALPMTGHEVEQLQKRANDYGRVRNKTVYQVAILGDPRKHVYDDGSYRPLLLDAGVTLEQAISGVFNEGGVMAVIHPQYGRPVTIRKTKTGAREMDVEYSASASFNATPLPTEFWPLIQNQFDLAAYYSPPTAEEMMEAVQEMGLPMYGVAATPPPPHPSAAYNPAPPAPYASPYGAPPPGTIPAYQPPAPGPAMAYPGAPLQHGYMPPLPPQPTVAMPQHQPPQPPQAWQPPPMPQGGPPPQGYGPPPGYPQPPPPNMSPPPMPAAPPMPHSPYPPQVGAMPALPPPSAPPPPPGAPGAPQAGWGPPPGLPPQPMAPPGAFQNPGPPPPQGMPVQGPVELRLPLAPGLSLPSGRQRCFGQFNPADNFCKECPEWIKSQCIPQTPGVQHTPMPTAQSELDKLQQAAIGRPA